MSQKSFGSTPYRKVSWFTKSIPYFLSLLMLIIPCASTSAEVVPGSYSVSPFVGGYLFDGSQELEHRPVYGLRLGYNFTEHWAAEAVFDYVQTNYKITDKTTNVFNYRLEGLYHFLPAGKLVPFLAIGIGGMSVDSSDPAADKNRATFDTGAGLKYSLTDSIALRADVRHILASGSTYNNLEYTIGLAFAFGGSKAGAVSTAQETVQAAPPGLALPTNLTATPISDSQINLAWDAAAGATGYKIYRDDSYVAAAQTTTAPDTGLQANTRYCYTVSAVDGMDRESNRSNRACATTLPLAVSQEQREEAAPATVAAPPAKAYELEDIHFDFDKFDLKPAAREILRRHAEWLNNNAEVNLEIIVEGHCDERGTKEYNLALGERRANAAAKYLIDLGIDARRLKTISYGFERPVDPRHDEEAWAKNRRAHIVIVDDAGSKK